MGQIFDPRWVRHAVLESKELFLCDNHCYIYISYIEELSREKMTAHPFENRESMGHPQGCCSESGTQMLLRVDAE